MFAQFHASSSGIVLNNNNFTLIVIILYPSSAYTITIVHNIFVTESFKPQLFFTHNVSSHNTAWILSESQLLALSCLLYRKVISLMMALEEECLCLHEISINVNKLLAVLLLPVYLYIHFLYWCCCLIFINSLIMYTSPLSFVFFWSFLLIKILLFLINFNCC